jgi:hypothetical protein
MVKNSNVYLFYISLAISFGILLAYLFDFLGIIQTINYCLISFSVTLLFLVLMIESKNGTKLSKSISYSSTIAGFVLWNLSLLEVFPMNQTWNFALLFMFLGLISAIHFTVTKRASQMMKLLTAFSALMLLSVIYTTGNAVFDNSMILISSLVLFTLFSMVSLFSSQKDFDRKNHS